MDLRSVFRHTQANIIAGNAVVIKGPPGFGKTDLMTKLASWWKQQNAGKSVGFSCFFMATQTPIGFTGLPWKGECEYNGKKWTVTDPAIPQWFMAMDLETGLYRPASEYDSVLLVIEEWGQGSPETKRAGAEVLRAGGTPPFYLPPGSPRVALTNIDARDGVTKEFDFIIGRRGELEVTGDVDVWLEDFADKPYRWQGKVWLVDPVVKAWAAANPTILFEPKPVKQGPWCNPRSLTNADRYIQSFTAMSAGKPVLADTGFLETLAGHIGMGAATSLAAHMQFAIDLPKYQDVVANPGSAPVPGKADLQMLMAYTMASRVKVADLGPVIQYMNRKEMPKDMAVTFITSLLRRDYKSIINEAPMKAWIAKNANLVSVISSLGQ